MCVKDELATLKNITKAAKESGVCQMPCSLNYLVFDHLPGKHLKQVYNLKI